MEEEFELRLTARELSFIHLIVRTLMLLNKANKARTISQDQETQHADPAYHTVE